MAQTLIARLRGILSSKTDDFFDDVDLLDYINEGYKAVYSRGISLEINQPKKGGRSIRALDKLRATTEKTGLSFSSFRTYKQVVIDISGDNIEQIAYVGALAGLEPILCTEIISSRKSELDWGLLFPTPQQGYYEFIQDSDTSSIRFLFGQAAGSATKITIDYFKQITLLTDSAETLTQLPDRLIHAVVLKAAVFSGVQETRENAKSFKDLYDEEIRDHLW